MSQEENPTPGGPGGAERRNDPRHASSAKIICYPAGAALTERRQVRLRNVSLKGLALVVDRRWEVGTELVLELPGPEERTVPGRARVVHATAQLGGLFLIGCILEVPLTAAQMQALTTG
jgi:hypothetical protein